MKEKDKDSVGYEIYRLRVEAGLTQEELAKYLNISVPTLVGYENGKTPNCEILTKLAQILDISTCAFIKGKMHGVCEAKNSMLSDGEKADEYEKQRVMKIRDEIKN